jgi:uncharacterized membrane protein (GlpM family)
MNNKNNNNIIIINRHAVFVLSVWRFISVYLYCFCVVCASLCWLCNWHLCCLACTLINTY